MATAIDTARYLIFLATNEEEPDYLTHLRLQKLLYYVQGWSLGMLGKPMFEERIEAWAHGPVVRDVYRIFADYGMLPIPYDQGDVPESLAGVDREFVDSVWEGYKGYSATHLRTMTHAEPPWLNARVGYAPADRCEVEITKEAMADYFGRCAREQQLQSA